MASLSLPAANQASPSSAYVSGMRVGAAVGWNSGCTTPCLWSETKNSPAPIRSTSSSTRRGSLRRPCLRSLSERPCKYIVDYFTYVLILPPWSRGGQGKTSYHRPKAAKRRYFGGLAAGPATFWPDPIRYNVETISGRLGQRLSLPGRATADHMNNLEDTSPAPARAEMPLGRRLAFIGLGVIFLLIVVLAGAAYAGYQVGLSDSQAHAQATQTAELQLQYDLGLEDLAAGRNEVAIERFEYIVRL